MWLVYRDRISAYCRIFPNSPEESAAFALAWLEHHNIILYCSDDMWSETVIEKCSSSTRTGLKTGNEKCVVMLSRFSRANLMPPPARRKSHFFGLATVLGPQGACEVTVAGGEIARNSLGDLEMSATWLLLGYGRRNGGFRLDIDVSHEFFFEKYSKRQCLVPALVQIQIRILQYQRSEVSYMFKHTFRVHFANYTIFRLVPNDSGLFVQFTKKKPGR